MKKAASESHGESLERSATSNLAERRYVAAGERAYVIGTTNGDFPPIGWHITGQMGGVWAHPIKLLDGYWFSLNSNWLTDAQIFTSGAGYVSMEFEPIDDMSVVRTEFSPDRLAAVLVRLRITNRGAADRHVSIRMDARSELMGVYPWGKACTPAAADVIKPDIGTYNHADGSLIFTQADQPWTAVVRAGTPPEAGSVGCAIWGSVSREDQGVYDQFGRGTGGRFEWTLELGTDKVTDLWVSVAGSHLSRARAETDAAEALKDPEARLAAKIAGRTELLNQSALSIPDPAIQSACEWSKLNLADLRRTVFDMKIRPTHAGKEYPPPVATLPQVTGIGAGFPDYVWFFGADGVYTLYALLAAGQWDTARGHLLALRDISDAVNGSTGKVIHEVLTEGSIFFGIDADPGDLNETPQFVIAVSLYWRWSGDHAFLEEVFPFVAKGMRHLVSSANPVGAGWPEGWGMVERPGMAAATLDVAAYTVAALRDLVGMAHAVDDSKTEAWAADEAERLAGAFDPAWWLDSASLYADSLCGTSDIAAGTAGCTTIGQMVQQGHWIAAVPMETDIAPIEHAQRALEVLASESFTGKYGLYHTAAGSSDGAELAVWTLPNAVMAAAEINYGRADHSLFYVDAIARMLDLEMPGALPEIAPSPAYDPFQPLTSRAMFMQAWSGYGVLWPVIHGYLGIDPDVPGGRLSVIPQLPSEWPELSVSKLRIGTGTVDVRAARTENVYTVTVSASAGICLTLGHVLPADVEEVVVRLDSREVEFQRSLTHRGVQVWVAVESSGSHEVTIMVGERGN